MRGRCNEATVSSPRMENGWKDIRTWTGLNDRYVPLFPSAFRGLEPEPGEIRGEIRREVSRPRHPGERVSGLCNSDQVAPRANQARSASE